MQKTIELLQVEKQKLELVLKTAEAETMELMKAEKLKLEQEVLLKTAQAEVCICILYFYGTYYCSYSQFFHLSSRTYFLLSKKQRMKMSI